MSQTQGEHEDMNMKNRFLTILAAGMMMAAGAALAGDGGGAADGGKTNGGGQDDGRTFVEMPKPQRDAFLAMMRGFVESMDDVNSALSEGDFREVARIAREDMGPAHEVMAALRSAGVPEDKITKVVTRARAAMQEVVDNGGGQPRIGRVVMQTLGPDVPDAFMSWKQEHMRSGGLGRFMPAEMHVMGVQMHLSAAALGDAAATVGDKPGVEDYKKVLGALNEITAQCRACHASWKVFK